MKAAPSGSAPPAALPSAMAAPAGRSRSLSSACSPGGTVSWYQKAHLVPMRAGLTVAAPLITWSPMPSFG